MSRAIGQEINYVQSLHNKEIVKKIAEGKKYSYMKKHYGIDRQTYKAIKARVW